MIVPDRLEFPKQNPNPQQSTSIFRHSGKLVRATIGLLAELPSIYSADLEEDETGLAKIEYHQTAGIRPKGPTS